MICLLHGYLLEGSGSNLWTRSVLHALARAGHTVHLVCQEAHADQYDFIAELRVYALDGTAELAWSRAVPYAGRVIMHKPVLGDLLPVYVWDKYEEFSRVVPMVDLSTEEIEQYISRNVAVVQRVVAENDITVLHANHVVLMAVVAERVSSTTGIPYIVMPHGSALEYAVRPDARFHAYASSALAHAAAVLVSADELGQRVRAMFPGIPGLAEKIGEVRVGVDTNAFAPIARAQRPANIATLEKVLQDSIGAGGDKEPDTDAAAKLASIDWSRDRIILFVGRIIVAKGIHCLIAALPQILQQEPNARLVIAGHGPLRGPLEALLSALRSGDRATAERIAQGHPADEKLATERLDGVPEYWQQLAEQGELERYYDACARLLKADTVQFVGYCTHRELRWLFPCCDVGVFPSMVKESGPMVFLEALSSGCFPVGTYFAGTKDKIDTVAPHLRSGDAEWMKVSPEPEHLAADLARVVPKALTVSERYALTLRRIAEQEYDWVPIASTLLRTLQEVAQQEHTQRL